MSEHKPYTYVTASIHEGVTRFNVSFYTSDMSAKALGGDGGRPFLTLSSAEAQMTVTTTGGGPVTEQDVTLAREIFTASARYLASCERLHAEQPTNLTNQTTPPGEVAA
ncbi:hypothetical protein GCM10022252_07990 [Streptosporangium oxazolinicum]|uniref:DUF1876 domain-containing protein n=1 Tax=Streptosporangium oxazolinicum TaxID=909287 RepID=A0ABP8ADQ0_9ACTN